LILTLRLHEDTTDSVLDMVAIVFFSSENPKVIQNCINKQMQTSLVVKKFKIVPPYTFKNFFKLENYIAYLVNIPSHVKRCQCIII
jgi:hypothetical protein